MRLATIAVASFAMTTDVVAGDQSCSHWSCGGNTPILWGVPIEGLNLDGEANAYGVQLAPQLWRSVAGGLRDTGCVLEVSRGRFLARTPSGAACPLSLTKLVFSLKVPTQKGCETSGTFAEVKMRIETGGTVDSWDLDANSAAVPTQRLVWHDLREAREVLDSRGETLELREGDSVCPMRDASWMEDWQTHTSEWHEEEVDDEIHRWLQPKKIATKSPWYAMTDHLLLVQGETYKEDSTIDAARRGPRWFNLACAGSAISKLRLLGYEPLRPETGSADERQATLKMLTARYRGARSYTTGGVPLVWQHKSGKRIAGQPAPELVPRDALIESRWNAAGATCLSHRRTWLRPEATSAKGNWRALVQATPEVSSHLRLSLGMLGSVLDYVGAEHRSLQNLRRVGVPPCSDLSAGTAFWTTLVVNHAHR